MGGSVLKTAAFIPIKSNSTRIPGKNFALYRDRPLYRWIIDHAMSSRAFDVVYVDTDSTEVKQYAESRGCVWIARRPDLAEDWANGNDLLCYHYDLHPEYDLYFQLFATAPLLAPPSISSCVQFLITHSEFDSISTATAKHIWAWERCDPFYDGEEVVGWMDGQPLYRPDILPRSQDARPLVVESTGMYGIRRDSLARLRQRCGASQFKFKIADGQAVDIDWPADLAPVEPSIETTW